MTTINHEVADLLQHEPEFEADEGYHTTKVLMLNDCDHGPCSHIRQRLDHVHIHQ